MSISELLSLSLKVAADWRVILTAVLTIFIISLSNYVIRYKKKPPVIKQKDQIKPKEAPKPEKKEEDEEPQEEE